MIYYDASGLNRLIRCNGSRNMTAGVIPAVIEQNQAALEGTAAHWLMATVIKNGRKPSEFIGSRLASGVVITDEMAEAVQYFFDAITVGSIVECDFQLDINAEIAVKCRPDSFYIDHVGRNVCVDDFKYGHSIVEPHDNWTMIAYALAIQEAYKLDGTYNYFLAIHQPRAYHKAGKSREIRLTDYDLLKYKYELQHALENLTNDISTGPHCYHCPAMSVCPSARQAALKAVEITQAGYNDEMTGDEIAIEIDMLERAEKIIDQRLKSIKELAIYRVKNGGIIPGYILENTLGNTQWNKNLTPEIIRLITGVDVAKSAMITPGQAQKKGLTPELLKCFTNRPSTGYALVKSDPAKMFEIKEK